MLLTYNKKGSEVIKEFADLLAQYGEDKNSLDGTVLGRLKSIAHNMRMEAIKVEMVEEIRDEYLTNLVDYHNRHSSCKYIIPGINDNEPTEEWD